jgi:putative YhdH/YhfP family quinone oxidoreductase
VERLPPGEALIRGCYSSLNYKDALAARGHRGVAKTLPHVPGVDAAGTVLRDRSGQFAAGQQVLVTGYELGAGWWGGFSELICVPADWVVPLPVGLSLRQAMIYGTAGFTAGLCCEGLIHQGVTPEQGEIVVTGASGGVGSHAVALLAHLGYAVCAVTGKNPSLALARGARRTLTRQEVLDESARPLLKSTWAGAVDCVGGATLASIIRATRQGGCVTACGLVGGAELSLTVYPFILRGVSLLGIDAAMTPRQRRFALWDKLAHDWRPKNLDAICEREVTLDDLPEQIARILAGETQGRVVVRLG